MAEDYTFRDFTVCAQGHGGVIVGEVSEGKWTLVEVSEVGERSPTFTYFFAFHLLSLTSANCHLPLPLRITVSFLNV